MTNRPKVRAGRPRTRDLDKLLASIKDHIPGARIVNRKIIIPHAVVQTPRRTYFPKLKAAATRPSEARLEERTTYTGMDKHYKEYRLNSLIRSCVNIRAIMATNKGFKVEVSHKNPEKDAEIHVELQEEHAELIGHINEINKKVNADEAWRIALVNMQVHGRAGFEIDREITGGPPTGLIPLRGDVLKPEYPKSIAGMSVGNPWQISSYEYDGKSEFFQPDDALYLPYNSLDGTRYGLSDIEAILDQSRTKTMIIREILPEALTVSWSGVAVMQIDSTDMTGAEEDEYMQSLVDSFQPSKLLVVNQKVTRIDVIDTKPNLEGIMRVSENLDLDIIGYFRIPPFVLGRHREVNRATAYAQLDQWINGDITDLQRKLRRLLDQEWYDRLHMQYAKIDRKALEALDYRVKQVWTPIKMIDFTETGNTLANLKRADGITIEEIYRLLGLDESNIKADLLAEIEREREVRKQLPEHTTRAPDEADDDESAR